MRNTKSRILVWLLVFVMVMSSLPAAVFATENAVDLKEWNITLEDNICVNFYVSIPEADVSTTVVSIEVDGKTTDYNASQATVKDGNYKFSAEVSAAQMNTDINLTVSTSGTQVYTVTKSVRGYAEYILTGNYADETKDMVKQMLNYGAAAQTYFQYNANNLVNSGYQIENPDNIPDAAQNEFYAKGSLAGMQLYGASLVFRSKIAVRFYFTAKPEGYTYTVAGEAVTPIEKDGLWYVEVDGINPQDYEVQSVVKVTDGNGNELEVGYSPMNYIVRMYNKDKEELKPLLLALYNYHLEAIAYQTYLDNQPVEPDVPDETVGEPVVGVVPGEEFNPFG